MDNNVKYIKQNANASWVLHLLLWPLAFSILLFVFSKGQQPVSIDFYYTLIFLLFVAVPVLINFYVLMKHLLKQEKYVWYILSLIALGILFGVLLENYFLIVLDWLFPDYFFISYLADNDFYLVLSILLLATTFIKLAEDWVFYNKNQNQLLTQQKQHIETQLTALRNQVNPHFLFNALNVIYALSLDKKEKITDAVVELSDILRYVIYDSNTDRVALKDEIELLKNYIAFQTHRIDNTPTQFDINIEDENFEIYPMLLLPLVENAYKYGASVDMPIKISIMQKDGSFSFKVYNTKVNTHNTLNETHSGFGLKHLRENLNIVYKDKHDFRIESSDDYFKVELSLFKN